ncbi:MAG: Crp/Fnr family transcriptional regulator [Deltaproteobacteria bacterium]|nr:Crp/Fnr family transcriptional regulator [Deltaproteobacteria bacterium]
MDIIEHLAAIPLFSGLSREDLDDLVPVVQYKTYQRGERIFAEGDEGTGFYVVISGRVKVYKLSFEGKEQILHMFEPGAPFGEAPVFAGKAFPANAEALEESVLLYFSRNAFIERINKNPSLSLNMLAILSERLHTFTRLIEDLSLKETPGRLAAYLLYLSERQGALDNLELGISKTQLASILGTIPETLSRIFSKMTKQGLIDSDGHGRFRILNRLMLERLAAGEVRFSQSGSHTEE